MTSYLLCPPCDQPEFILVRADESKDRIHTGEFIFVRYNRSAKQEEQLREGFFKAMAHWQFTLTRIDGSDGPLRDILYSKSDRERDGTVRPLMAFVPGAEHEDLRLDVIVPRYEATLGSVNAIRI